MDLTITITDEDGEILDKLNIYQDGSDSEGTGQIVAYLISTYTVTGEEEVSNDTVEERLNKRISALAASLVRHHE